MTAQGIVVLANIGICRMPASGATQRRRPVRRTAHLSLGQLPRSSARRADHALAGRIRRRKGYSMKDSQGATPEFSVQMRGYDQREVDEFLRQLAVNLELAVPAFAQRMRGYSAEQVDAYIAFMKGQSRP
jgi:DivIVA domain-containing protein